MKVSSNHKVGIFHRSPDRNAGRLLVVMHGRLPRNPHRRAIGAAAGRIHDRRFARARRSGGADGQVASRRRFRAGRAIWGDGEDNKHALALVKGATKNSSTVQALLTNLVSCGFPATVPRLYILDSAKALSRTIRYTFGSTAAIQRCQTASCATIGQQGLPTIQGG